MRAAFLGAILQALRQILWAIASFPALVVAVAARAFVPLAAAQADYAAKSAAVRVIFAAITAMGAGISLAPAKYPCMPARASV